MVRRKLSHVVDIPNLLNKKIVFEKFGMIKKLSPSLQSKKIKNATEAITYSNREKV
jgi:hypothetical protein